MTYKPRTEEGTPLDSAIAEMDIIVERYSDNREYLELVKSSLVRIKELHGSGEITTRQASAELFDTYFEHQSQVQGFFPLPGILRVVGDDFGVQLGENPDDIWDLYQQSLDGHRRQV